VSHLPYPPLPFGVGQFQELLTSSVSFSFISNNSVTSRCVDVFWDQDYAIQSCPAVVFASQLAFVGELRRELLRNELYWCRQVCLLSYSNTIIDSPSLPLDLHSSWVCKLVVLQQYGTVDYKTCGIMN
jgi:hypothetical protein